MELRQLRYLSTMLARGTFAAAAEHERVAQPALWNQIRALEREWGVCLFERVGRRVRPTAALLSLRGPLSTLLADARCLQEQAEAIRTGLAGPIRIPATPYPQVASFIAEAIAEYAQRYPGAPLPTRVPIDPSTTYEALARGEIDLTAGVPPRGSTFASAPLRQVRIVALGSGITRAIELDALADRPLALFTADAQARRQLDDAFRARRLVPRVAYEDVHAEALLVLARRGVAVAVLPSDALPGSVDLPVGELLHRGRPLGGQLALLWRDDQTLSTSARRFRDILLERAAGTPQQKAGKRRA